MEVGELNERITIESLSTTKQSNGEVTESWSTVDTIWAKAIPESGQEDYQGDKKISIQNYRFIIRERSDLDVTSRISWRGHQWDIRAINPYHKEGYNNYKEIKVKKVEG